MNEAAGGASGAAAAGPDTPGGMLRAERERRGYSVQHAAEDLHLDAWVIEAIEANRFEALGAPVYAEGTCASTQRSSACRRRRCSSATKRSAARRPIQRRFRSQ